MEFIRTLDVKFDVGDTTRLTLESQSGTVAVRGDGGRTVRVEVVARLWAEDDAEADDQAELIRRAIRHEGDKVTVRAPALLRPRPFLFFGHSSPRLDHQIPVPTTPEPRTETRSGLSSVGPIARTPRTTPRRGHVRVRPLPSAADTRRRRARGQAVGLKPPRNPLG